MKKTTIINHNRDYKRVYNRGTSVASSNVVTYVLKNKLGFNRVGITASKKIGNAVKRNRSRRVIRAAYAEVCEKLEPGYDIIFVARAKTYSAKTQEILKSMQYHLKKFGVLQWKIF